MAQLKTIFCPYVGLQPYTEAESEYFFGRERDTRVIVSNLFASSLTVLYGASGVGKSSVLLAGVVPRLRATPRTAVIVFREWQNETFMVALKSACIAAVEQANGKPVPLDANLPFDELLGQAAQKLNGSLAVLLDQFEEYFLYHPESSASDSFDAEFARAVNREDVNASFLLVLREDGLSKLDRFRTRIPNLLGNTLRLQHLDVSAAEDAIRKPLAVYNTRYEKSVSIEDALVRQVIQSINVQSSSETPSNDARIETPFLQLVMTRLWDEEMKAGSSALQLSTLQRLGGAVRIVRTHLDRVMNQLSEGERSTSALFFDRLVTPSGTKIALRVDDLVSYAQRSEQQVKPILKKLSDGRVLRPIAPPPGQPSATRYEIFHDVLASAILDWRKRYLEQKRSRRLQFISAAFVTFALVAFALMAYTYWWIPSQKAQLLNGSLKVASPRVLMIVYNPVVDPSTGKKLIQAMSWNDPDLLAAGFIADIDDTSDGLVKYQIVERIEIDGIPVKADGFQYTPQNYIKVVTSNVGAHDPEFVDYNAILSQFNLLQRVAAGEFDEVWLFGGPYFGFYETTMAGPRVYFLNSNPIPNTSQSPARFVVMGFNYQRGVLDMLDGFGHRAEGILAHLFGSESFLMWVYNRERNPKTVTTVRNDFERFLLFDQIAPGQANVGTVHYSPNSTNDYEWGTATPVLSAADDWFKYPNLPNPPNYKMMSTSDWGSGDGRAYIKWWLKHLPKVSGTKNGIANNWWKYIADPNYLP